MKKSDCVIFSRKIRWSFIHRILVLLNLIIIFIIPVFAVGSLESLAETQTSIKNISEEFKDIKESDWYAETVLKLVDLGIINGYEDGTFRPQGNIQVDAFIKMTVASLGYELENGKDYWAELYIEKAKELKLVEKDGFSDYTKPINRAEIARIIIRALDEKFPNDINEYISQINDYQSIPDEFKEYVLKAYVKGIVTGYPNGSFGYDKNATRAEASAMLIRMLDEGERKIPKKEEIAERTKELTEEDIKRLEGYEVWSKTRDLDGNLTVDPNYISFEDMFKKKKSTCEWLIKEFNPKKTKTYEGDSLYPGAEINWFKSSRLVYKTPICSYGIRGIIQIRYTCDENLYKLKSNKWYECDAEFRFDSTTDGKYVEEFNHLSDWKQVK